MNIVGLTRRYHRQSSMALLLTAALVGLPQIAAAQTAGGDAQAESAEKAEAYYQQGVNAFFNKNYSLAVTYFKRANALDPDPVVLYNISLAYSRLANAEEALQAALQAEEMGDMPEDTRLKNRARIQAYQRILQAEKIADRLSPADAPGAGHVQAPGSAQPGSADEGMGVLGWAGIGTAGAGVLALAGAGVMALIVRQDLDDYDTARADGNFERAVGLQDDITSGQSMGQILLYSGVGLLAVGATLWTIDFLGDAEAPAEQGSASSSLSLRGAADPTGANLRLRFDF